MEEIRFTRSEPPKIVPNEMRAPNNQNKKSSLKNVLIFLICLLVLVIISLAIYAGRKTWMAKEDPSASLYYAAFLANGQVYFGQLKEKSSDEFVLKNVYYLQIAGAGTAQQELSESKFSLVKLGDELHGPTDEMYINTKNLLFYEKLKKDSKVVQSIESGKK